MNNRAAIFAAHGLPAANRKPEVKVRSNANRVIWLGVMGRTLTASASFRAINSSQRTGFPADTALSEFMLASEFSFLEYYLLDHILPCRLPMDKLNEQRASACRWLKLSHGIYRSRQCGDSLCGSFNPFTCRIIISNDK